MTRAKDICVLNAYEICVDLVGAGSGRLAKKVGFFSKLQTIIFLKKLKIL